MVHRLPPYNQLAAEEAFSWRESTGVQIGLYHCIHVHTSTYQYVLVCTSIYPYIQLPVLIPSFQYVLVCTSIYQYIQLEVHISIYRCVLVCAGIYWYILLYLTCCSSAEGLLCVQDIIAVIPPYPYSIT